MKRIGVLISGNGTNLQAIIDGIESGNIPGEIAVVISNRSTAYGLERARMHGIPAKCILKKDYNNDHEFNKAILETLQYYNVELVVLAGYLSILSPDVVKAYRNRIINTHCSLIPAFCGKGFYGKSAQGCIGIRRKGDGATVHFADEGADTGPIILQQPVAIRDDDDVDSLAQRVLDVEHQLLSRAVKLLIEGKVKVNGRKVSISE